MDRPKCLTCVYWDGVSVTTGYCRRNPPDSSTLRWPTTDSTSWCGQHHKFPAWLYQPDPPKPVEEVRTSG